jgi:hypothetical protein
MKQRSGRWTGRRFASSSAKKLHVFIQVWSLLTGKRGNSCGGSEICNWVVHEETGCVTEVGECMCGVETAVSYVLGFDGDSVSAGKSQRELQ